MKELKIMSVRKLLQEENIERKRYPAVAAVFLIITFSQLRHHCFDSARVRPVLLFLTVPI